MANNGSSETNPVTGELEALKPTGQEPEAPRQFVVPTKDACQAVKKDLLPGKEEKPENQEAD